MGYFTSFVKHNWCLVLSLDNRCLLDNAAKRIEPANTMKTDGINMITLDNMN